MPQQTSGLRQALTAARFQCKEQPLHEERGDVELESEKQHHPESKQIEVYIRPEKQESFRQKKQEQIQEQEGYCPENV